MKQLIFCSYIYCSRRIISAHSLFVTFVQLQLVNLMIVKNDLIFSISDAYSALVRTKPCILRNGLRPAELCR